MTSAIETALTELSANLRRMEQRHQAVGYKFDRLYGLIDAAREELAGLTADAVRYRYIRTGKHYAVKVGKDTVHCGGHSVSLKYGPALDQAVDGARGAE